MIEPGIFSLKEHILNGCYVSGTFLGAGDEAGNKQIRAVL